MKLDLALNCVLFFVSRYNAGHRLDVAFRPTTPGAVVPPFFRHEESVTFAYGRNLPIPITDLALDTVGISATLSFRGELIATFVPWSSIYAIICDAEKYAAPGPLTPVDQKQLTPVPAPTPPVAPATAPPSAPGGKLLEFPSSRKKPGSEKPS